MGFPRFRAAPVRAGLMLVLLAGCGVAAAQARDPADSATAADSGGGDHPPLTPTRDVTVTYHVTSHGQAPDSDVTVRFSGSGDFLRVDSGDGRGITILDRPRQLVTLVMVPRRMYARIRPQSGLESPFMLGLDMTYARKGAEVVAGLPCTRWAITSPRGDASACVTEDGVILDESGVDADGATGSVRAVKVSYGDLPSGTFQPPPGFHEIVPRGTRNAANQGNANPGNANPGGVNPGSDQGQNQGQPSVANDSAGDGSVAQPDQPPSGAQR